jgi:hypothetical protein
MDKHTDPWTYQRWGSGVRKHEPLDIPKVGDQVLEKHGPLDIPEVGVTYE